MARKKKAEKENNERWLLTYADLITLLMVFFVLLFAMSKTDAAKFQQLAQSLHSALNPSLFQTSGNPMSTSNTGSSNSILESQLFNQITQSITQIESQLNIPQSSIQATMTKEGISVTVSGALLFYNGTNQIKPDGITLLQKLGPILHGIPNNVRVEGYTDDVPVDTSQYPTNWELSAARAVSVVRYLSEVDQIDPGRLSAVGYGQFHPIVPNDSRQHREENRRAVIVILYGQQDTGIITPVPLTPTP